MADDPLSGMFAVSTKDGKTTAYHNGQPIGRYAKTEGTVAGARIAPALDPMVFISPKLKIERAKKHIAELEAAIGAYAATNPYEHVMHVDEQTGENVVSMRVNKPPPTEISAIVGDVVHNLRASLDGVVCDVFRAHNQGAEAWEKGFPISEKPKRLKAGTSGKIKGVGVKAERLIGRLQASKGWNDPMWALHWLDIVDKHNRIHTVAAASLEITAKVGVPGMFVGPDGNIRLLGPGPGGVPLMVDAGTPAQFKRVQLSDQYVEVHRTPAGFNEDINLALGVAFSQSKVVEGEPVLETLKQFCDLVERTLWVFERRAL